HVKEFTRKEFLALLNPFKVQLFGQILLDRRGAALWEGKELAKRVLRAFIPVRRFRPAAQRRLGELEPDPAYAVLPCGSRPCGKGRSWRSGCSAPSFPSGASGRRRNVAWASSSPTRRTPSSPAVR